MTVQQAQAKINKCEQDIIRAHSSLCNAARNVGASAKKNGKGIKIKKTLMWLSLFIGLFFPPILFIGIVIAIMNRKAGQVVNNVELAQKQLNSTIDNNSKI